MIWSGLLLGLAGSLHCAGMCGPLVLAIGKNTTAYQLIHHAGRIISYLMVGLLVGWGVSELPGAIWQSAWKIGASVLLLGIAFFQISRTRINLKWVFAGWRWIMGKAFKLPGLARPALVGLAHGFLPCGLSFAAALTAGVFSSKAESIAFMGLFGLGTLPALLGFQGLLAPILAKRKYLTVLFLGLSAAWLLFTGINGLLLNESDIPANCHS